MLLPEIVKLKLNQIKKDKLKLIKIISQFALVVVLSFYLATTQATPDLKGVTSLSRTTTEALAQKRYVAAGEYAYVIGTGDGRFPPLGWHITGEMGGVWSHPIKLLDGYQLALNSKPLPPAQQLTTQLGYIELDYGQVEGYEVRRIEVVPNKLPVVLVGLTVKNLKPSDRKLTVTLEACSELMAAYPWDNSQPQSAQSFNQADEVTSSAKDGTLTFREPGKSWYAKLGSSLPETKGVRDEQLSIDVTQTPTANIKGKGARGQMEWRLQLLKGSSTTIWWAVAGSHQSETEATRALTKALAAPEALLRAKVENRQQLLVQTQVILPDASVQAAFDWSKLNLADLRRSVRQLQIRDIAQGTTYPPPVTTLPILSGIGAGLPDYPWFFGIDGAYSTYGLIASGQWETAMSHLRGLREVSRAINGNTGKVIHEVVTDGSVYYGSNADAGNLNETAQLAIALELFWQWSGNEAFRDELYDFVVEGLTYITSVLDSDGDGWSEGLGAIERPGMGAEPLDVAAYTLQALRALERMASSKKDLKTSSWAKNQGDHLESSFDRAWWLAQENLYADSQCNQEQDHSRSVCTQAGERLQQRHWISAIPMETAVAPPDRAIAALDRLESQTFTGKTGLYHTGKGGGRDGQGELKVWTLPNAVMAVAEANYGRVDQALQYVKAIASQLDLEMPGALPEILPSPQYHPFAPFSERGMFMQAWSSYGIQWPVIHHFLGIVPNVPDKTLSVIPQIPTTWPSLSVQNLRIGEGTIAVSARKKGKQYITTVEASSDWDLSIGQVLPQAGTIASVTLDGRSLPYQVTQSLRGRQVTVKTTAQKVHILAIALN